MPRRFLATRRKAQSAVGDRLRTALVYELERPSELIVVWKRYTIPVTLLY